MIRRIMRESRRYDVEPSANGMVIVDTYLNLPVYIPREGYETGVSELCLSMTRHAVCNALRWPTPAMIAAGGPDSEAIWSRMIEALV